MPASLPLLIVQMGSPPDDLLHQFGDQSDWFRTALGDTARDIRVAHPDLGEELPDMSEFSAAVITGSWSMVTDRADWSERTGQWAKRLIEADKPLLGVCYGHQLMADVMGGIVGYHPNGRELGTLPITLNALGCDDPWTSHLPPVFNAHLTHAQTVLVPPPGARLLGSSEHDPHQVLRYGSNTLSVQFHPEFSEELLNACVAKRETVLAAEGMDLDELRSGIEETPYARQILLRFANKYSGTGSPS